MPKLIEAHNKQNPKTQLLHAGLHDLRHVHATTLLLAGAPVHVVAARLGHADPAITLRVYASSPRLSADSGEPPGSHRVSKGVSKISTLS
ncbi:tyrosine-type recombinase/integrase [Nonomuraea sp. CA-141351]|uniref:tyrosine-type recombinase/integrase n=1 Tax=Nonomuraea sp. CA-141351 TaxID=3239996 RepID=UPI003D8DE11E